MGSEETVRRVVGPTILLRSGEYFDFLAPETSIFTIDDIAHGLSNCCRFAGQCSHFYSVAEHSVLVSRIVPPEDALAALLHDAAEAFMGDMVKPLKVMMPQFKEIEERVERAIFVQFGLPFPMPESVREADIVMLATEQLRLMKNRDDWEYTRGRKPARVTIVGMEPRIAKDTFLWRYYELVSLRKKRVR